MYSIVMALLMITPGPYEIPSQTEEPTTITSSWYGEEFDGRKTASGEVFRANDPEMAAHRELPFGTRVLLENPSTGQKQEVTISDRGPFHDNRDLDVSEAAAENLGFKDEGVASLEATIISKP